MDEEYYIYRGKDSGVFLACDVRRNGRKAKFGWSRRILPSYGTGGMIHYWEGAAGLSQLSVDGIKSGRVCVPVEGRVILDVCEILPCTKRAVANLLAQPNWVAE